MRNIDCTNNQRTRRDDRMRILRLSNILPSIITTRQSKVHTTQLRCCSYRPTTTTTTTTIAAVDCCRWTGSAGKRGALSGEEGMDMGPSLDDGDDEENDDY